jgi:hypothetical protein
MMVGIGMIVVSDPDDGRRAEDHLDADRHGPDAARADAGADHDLDLFKNYWWAGAAGHRRHVVRVERIYKPQRRGRLFIDRATCCALPVLGDLLRKQAVARFTHTLSTLLQSGVPVGAERSRSPATSSATA